MPARLLAIALLSAGICTAAFLAANAARPRPPAAPANAAPLLLEWKGSDPGVSQGLLVNRGAVPLAGVRLAVAVASIETRQGFVFRPQVRPELAHWFLPDHHRLGDEPTEVAVDLAPGQRELFILWRGPLAFPATVAAEDASGAKLEVEQRIVPP